MRHPIRHLAGNLIWTRHGIVWAVWRVDAPQYRNTPHPTRSEVLQRTEALLKALPAGEAMLLSLCPQADPDDVLARMLAGVDPDACPAWAEACHAGAEILAEFVLTERTHWLALPLPYASGQGRLADVAAAAWSQVAETVGLPAPPVTAKQVAAYRRLADKIANSLPGVAMRPADPAEVLWMYSRAPLRGLAEPPLVRGEAGGSHVVGELLRGPSLAGLDQVCFDEGGKSGRALVSPFAHRYAAVTHPDFPDQPSYQAFLTLAEMPAAFAFPGSEYLERLDDFGFPIDWAARLTLVPRDKAEAHSRRRARELSEQAVQRGDGSGTLPSDLEQALRDLDEYRAELSASASQVEVQSRVVFCVWSTEPDLVDEYADTLRRELAPSDYQIVRPAGAQTDLYAAMLPGNPCPRVLRDYTQYLFAKDFAMAIPFSATELGDPHGGLLGVRVDSSGTAPVLHDPSYGPRQLHTSASAGFIGELGGGKSVTMKVLLDLIVRRGGLALAIDRTPSQEWAHFVDAVPGKSSTLRVAADAAFSLDPLRCFDPESAQRYTEGFLGLLLGIEPLSSEGALLSEAISSVLASDSPSMHGLFEALTAANDPRSVDIGRRLAAAQRLDLAATVFDERLPALEITDVDNSMLVFSTHGIALPDRDELANEYQLRQLPPEKRLGRAVMYLLAAICRDKAFAADGFAGVFLDECYWLTSSSEGERLALELVRDGRKHDAAVYLGGHDPADLGNEVISGLLGQRFLFRHRDGNLAERGLTWLGLEPDADLVHLVTRDLSPVDVPPDQQEERAGECLYRDCRGRISLMKVLIPNLTGISEAIRTNPAGGASR